MAAPAICATPIIMYHTIIVSKVLKTHTNHSLRPALRTCSALVYHIPVMRMSAGATQASKSPRRNLRATREPKLLAAPCAAVMIPQQQMFAPRYFARGKRCIKRFVPGSATRYATLTIQHKKPSDSHTTYVENSAEQSILGGTDASVFP